MSMDGMGWVVVLWLSVGVQGQCRVLPVLGVSGEIGARMGGGRNVGAEFLSRSGFNKFSCTF